ncbi:MAG: single-stranded DNA-binding protein [Dehalococcoidales bacterium]
MSVNKVILVGSLGQNPELKYTPSGAAVANFSVATIYSFTNKNGVKQTKTEWHRVVAWGKQAEAISNCFTKGKPISLEGALETRQWTDNNDQTRYTTEIKLQGFGFVPKDNTASTDQETQQSETPESDPTEDDIHF